MTKVLNFVKFQILWHLILFYIWIPELAGSLSTQLIERKEQRPLNGNHSDDVALAEVVTTLRLS